MNENIIEQIIKANVDLNQAAKYFLNSEYEGGYKNLLEVVVTIKNLITSIDHQKLSK